MTLSHTDTCTSTTSSHWNRSLSLIYPSLSGCELRMHLRPHNHSDHYRVVFSHDNTSLLKWDKKDEHVGKRLLWAVAFLVCFERWIVFKGKFWPRKRLNIYLKYADCVQEWNPGDRQRSLFTFLCCLNENGFSFSVKTIPKN